MATCIEVCSDQVWKIDSRGHLSNDCMARIPMGLIRPKLAGFILEYDAKVVEVSEDRILIHIGKTGMFAPRPKPTAEPCFPLEVEIHLIRSTECMSWMTHLRVELRPLGDRVSEHERDLRLRIVLRSIRAHLFARDLERRFSDRVRMDTPVSVWPISESNAQPDWNQEFSGHLHDVSADGLGFSLSELVSTPHFFVRYQNPDSECVVWTRASLVRSSEREEGHYYGVRTL